MNTGQMMLVIGAFAMLATLALSINGTIINTMSLSVESEMAMNAHAFAQSMLDEILTKWFDQRAISTKIYKYSDMTAYGSLGPDGGEFFPLVGGYDVNFKSMTFFNDVDDYHRYKRKITNNLGWVFTVIDSIDYVYEGKDSTDMRSPTQTFYKRITVYVYNDNMAKDASGNVIPTIMKDFAVYRRYF
ncbi:MAG: hypothetical protein HRF40_01955 [Nitrososphaera sp.]|jgi:hypothetical protein